MYSGKIAVPPGGGGIVLHKNTHYNVRVLEIDLTEPKLKKHISR
jgi:hypothetical protein